MKLLHSGGVIVLSVYLVGCSTFNLLNGGVQIKPLPENEKIVISQRNGRLCFQVGKQDRCYKREDVPGLRAYQRLPEYRTYAKFECNHPHDPVRECQVSSQIAGPLGGDNILGDERRIWSKPVCYWLIDDGFSLGDCVDAWKRRQEIQLAQREEADRRWAQHQEASRQRREREVKGSNKLNYYTVSIYPKLTADRVPSVFGEKSTEGHLLSELWIND